MGDLNPAIWSEYKHSRMCTFFIQAYCTLFNQLIVSNWLIDINYRDVQANPPAEAICLYGYGLRRRLGAVGKQLGQRLVIVA